jgi:hypothetical protein
MDEAARAAGTDPVAFRVRLLDGAGGNAWFGPERRRWSEAPSGGRPTCGAEGRLGCRHAEEGHGAWHRDHIWTGTRYADLDRLRRARAGPTAAAVR